MPPIFFKEGLFDFERTTVDLLWLEEKVLWSNQTDSNFSLILTVFFSIQIILKQTMNCVLENSKVIACIGSKYAKYSGYFRFQAKFIGFLERTDILQKWNAFELIHMSPQCREIKITLSRLGMPETAPFSESDSYKLSS